MITSEPALPHAISQHGHSRSSGLVLARLKSTPDNRLDTEHREEVRRYRWSEHALRFPATAHDSATACVGCESLEDLVLLVVLKIGIGKLALCKLLLRRALEKVIKAIGRSIGKPAQKCRVDNCKDRRTTADTKGQRDDRNQREAGFIQHCANGVAQVL